MMICNNKHSWEVVVAQLVEWSLPIPEVCGSNPITSKVFIEYSLLSTVLKRRKKEKEAGNGPFFLKKSLALLQFDPTSTVTL